MFERFTPAARRAVVDAQVEARQLGHRIVGTEHLLLGLLADTDGLAARALHRFGVRPASVRAWIAQIVGQTPGARLDADALASIGIDLDAVRTRVEDAFGPGALDHPRRCRRGAQRGYMPVSPRAKKVLELSLREAVRRKTRSIGTEHLLLGILREGKGLAAGLLAQSGVDRRAVETVIDELLQRDGRADTG